MSVIRPGIRRARVKRELAERFIVCSAQAPSRSEEESLWYSEAVMRRVPCLSAMYRVTCQRQMAWYMATPFHYVYVLISEKDGQFYIGSTSDLRKRLIKHQKAHVGATRARLPVNLVFYEAYINKFDSLRREDYFKTTKGKRTLRNMLKEYLHA